MSPVLQCILCASERKKFRIYATLQIKIIIINHINIIAALQKPVKTSTPLTHVVNGTNMPVDDDGIRAHLQKLDKKLQQVMDVLKSEPQPGGWTQGWIGSVG